MILDAIECLNAREVARKTVQPVRNAANTVSFWGAKGVRGGEGGGAAREGCSLPFATFEGVAGSVLILEPACIRL